MGSIRLYDATSPAEKAARRCYSTHEFFLDLRGAHCDCPSLRIREGCTTGDCLGAASADQTAGIIWGASLVLGRWIASSTELRQQLEGQTVCELGAGCGLAGLAAACFAKPSRVVLSDSNLSTLVNLRTNVANNAGRDHGRRVAGASARLVFGWPWRQPHIPSTARASGARRRPCVR